MTYKIIQGELLHTVLKDGEQIAFFASLTDAQYYVGRREEDNAILVDLPYVNGTKQPEGPQLVDIKLTGPVYVIRNRMRRHG